MKRIKEHKEKKLYLFVFFLILPFKHNLPLHVHPQDLPNGVARQRSLQFPFFSEHALVPERKEKFMIERALKKPQNAR